MHNLDLNYLYFLAEKAEKEEDSNLRGEWLESLKEHITYMDRFQSEVNPMMSNNGYNNIFTQTS